MYLGSVGFNALLGGPSNYEWLLRITQGPSGRSCCYAMFGGSESTKMVVGANFEVFCSAVITKNCSSAEVRRWSLIPC